MKDFYVNVQMEVIHLEEQDVIATSGIVLQPEDNENMGDIH